MCKAFAHGRCSGLVAFPLSLSCFIADEAVVTRGKAIFLRSKSQWWRTEAKPFDGSSRAHCALPSSHPAQSNFLLRCTFGVYTPTDFFVVQTPQLPFSSRWAFCFAVSAPLHGCVPAGFCAYCLWLVSAVFYMLFGSSGQMSLTQLCPWTVKSGSPGGDRAAVVTSGQMGS